MWHSIQFLFNHDKNNVIVWSLYILLCYLALIKIERVLKLSESIDFIILCFYAYLLNEMVRNETQTY